MGVEKEHVVNHIVERNAVEENKKLEEKGEKKGLGKKDKYYDRLNYKLNKK